MNWQTYWAALAHDPDPQRQVARTRVGQPVDEETLGQIVACISERLALRPEDHLLDVCCGNGVLTRHLALICRETVGVDISPPHIRLARAQHTAPGLTYLTGDATRLGDVLDSTFDKICLYFSFQYLDTYAKGLLAIQGMARLLKPGGRILLGDVPDSARLRVFFPRWQDRARYYLQVASGRSPMGKFWSADEIRRIAAACGLRVSVLSQPTHLPYASYRTDYVLTWI
ncbi:MAG: class I SAM-dependent methyltransferase [Bacteroidia bacterium]|nr:class I SAM-dependent methyltransferase [Bacteroidia bacterium]